MRRWSSGPSGPAGRSPAVATPASRRSLEFTRTCAGGRPSGASTALRGGRVRIAPQPADRRSASDRPALPPSKAASRRTMTPDPTVIGASDFNSAAFQSIVHRSEQRPPDPDDVAPRSDIPTTRDPDDDAAFHPRCDRSPAGAVDPGCADGRARGRVGRRGPPARTPGCRARAGGHPPPVARRGDDRLRSGRRHRRGRQPRGGRPGPGHRGLDAPDRPRGPRRAVPRPRVPLRAGHGDRRWQAA